MPACLRCLVAAMRQRARLYPSIESGTFKRHRRDSLARVAAMAWRPGWDAAPRTEHAVLAAGEALEVAAAAHCRRAVLFVVRAVCCAILARELHALLTASQAGCSECSVWAIAADALFCSSSSCEALINTHAYLAIGQLVGACEAAKKRATETWHMTATPHAYAKQQHSTSPEGRYPSQSVAHKQSATAR